MADKHVEQTKQQAGNEPAIAAAVHTETSGVTELRSMVAKSRPDPHDVVALIDAHRSERDQMMALLQSTLGNGYVQEVVAAQNHLRASIKRREVVDGDPSQPDSGYFVASQELGGAKWRTGDGDFTGTIDKKGLDSRYRLDDNDALLGRIDAKDKTASLGWEHDGKEQGELYAHKGKQDDVSTTDLGVRRGYELGGGTGTYGLRHQSRGDGTSNDGISGTWKDGTTSAEGFVARDSNGGLAAGAQASTSMKLDPQTTAAGSLSYLHDQHGSQSTLNLSEHRRTGNYVQDSHLTLGAGNRDYVDTGGSIETQLGENLYGGAFGNYHAEKGQHPTAQVGGSLTFTATEKTALTLAGVIDQNGSLETRLQLDVFKSRIDGVGALSDHQKSALVSLFVSYTTGATASSALDDRFGAPQLETSTHDNKVMFGFKVKF